MKMECPAPSLEHLTTIGEPIVYANAVAYRYRDDSTGEIYEMLVNRQGNRASKWFKITK